MKKHACKALLLSATLSACTLTASHAAPKPKPTPKSTPRVTVPASQVSQTPRPTPAPSPVPPITQYAFGAMKYMRASIGKSYVMGGTGPDVYDCSGLIQAAWKSVGVTLPRTSGQQYAATVRISYQDLQPGDLVFFGYHGAHHVGMYIGNNQMIDAANPRRDVTYSDLTQDWYVRNLGGYGRIPATDI